MKVSTFLEHPWKWNFCILWGLHPLWSLAGSLLRTWFSHKKAYWVESLLRSYSSTDITLPTKVCTVTANDFSSSQVWMWKFDHKEVWELKNWCFWTVVLEKTLESPLDFREIKPVNPKGNQPWIFIGRTDAEVPILWPSDEKNWLIGKDPDVGNDWRQEGKGMTREWDGCMASPRWWTSVWASSQSWKPSMLQSMGSQRVRQDWVTELTDFPTQNY